MLEVVKDFQAAVAAQVARCRPDAAEFDRQALSGGLTDLQHRWHDLKTALLEAAGRRALPLGCVNGALDGLRGGLRMTEQLTKAAARLDQLMPRQAAQAAEH